MKKKITFILCFILGISSSALAWKNTIFTHRDNYYKTLKQFTRHDNDISIDNLSAKLQWYATYKSPDFTVAFRDFYQELYPHQPANLANQRAQPWLNDSSQAEFFVAIYASSRDLEKLDQDSLWDLSLRLGNQIYKPTRIEKIKATSFEKKFFPYTEAWHQTYRVVFAARPNASESLDLQIQGAGGISTLHF